MLLERGIQPAPPGYDQWLQTYKPKKPKSAKLADNINDGSISRPTTRASSAKAQSIAASAVVVKPTSPVPRASNQHRLTTPHASNLIGSNPTISQTPAHTLNQQTTLISSIETDTSAALKHPVASRPTQTTIPSRPAKSKPDASPILHSPSPSLSPPVPSARSTQLSKPFTDLETDFPPGNHDIEDEIYSASPPRATGRNTQAGNGPRRQTQLPDSADDESDEESRATNYRGIRQEPPRGTDSAENSSEGRLAAYKHKLHESRVARARQGKQPVVSTPY